MALRFWVGGTGTWDASDTTHWAATSGAGGGQSVPVSVDSVTFDGSSGGGTVTVNTTVDVVTIVCGAHTGTLDFSAHNNNVTMQTFNGSGTGTRTLNMGNGTWTISGGASVNWNILTTTNLTFNANSSTINILSSSAARSFTGNLTYNIITISASSSVAPFTFNAGCTIGTLNIAGPNEIIFTVTTTYPITTLNIIGTSGSEVSLRTNIDSSASTLSVAANAPSIAWTAFRDITCSGGASFVAADSFDLGKNTGVTINAPGGTGTSISRGVSRSRIQSGF